MAMPPQHIGRAARAPRELGFHRLLGAWLLAHFGLLWLELLQLGPAPQLAPPSALAAWVAWADLRVGSGPQALLMAVTGVGALASAVIAVGGTSRAAALVAFGGAVLTRAMLPGSAPDDLLVSLAAFLLCAALLPSHGCAGGTVTALRLVYPAYLVLVWVCYLAPGPWAGPARAGLGLHSLLALAPPLYLLRTPIAVAAATLIQVLVHGALAHEHGAVIAHGLLASSALLFRRVSSIDWGRASIQIDFGSVMGGNVAALAALLLLMQPLGLHDEAQRVQLALAGIGLDLHIDEPGGERWTVIVGDARGGETSLEGPRLNRRWRAQLSLGLAAADRGGRTIARSAWAVLSSHCEQVDGAGHRRLVGTDPQNGGRRHLLDFRCEGGEAIATAPSPTEREARTRSPYAL